MYCVKCGVELADSERSCPLCGTRVICPDSEQNTAPSPYPPYPGAVSDGLSRVSIMFIITALFLLPFMLCFICDFKINGRMVWSGYASGAILLTYVITMLPQWFKNPNPVIFIPIDFAAIELFLLYINAATGGAWFLSFAFPTVGCMALILTAAVALLKYTRGAKAFILGGALILFGGMSVLTEFFLYITFEPLGMFKWSLYPMSVLLVLGIMLIIIGICKPMKESLRRKLFF